MCNGILINVFDFIRFLGCITSLNVADIPFVFRSWAGQECLKQLFLSPFIAIQISHEQTFNNLANLFLISTFGEYSDNIREIIQNCSAILHELEELRSVYLFFKPSLLMILFFINNSADWH